MAPVTRTDEFWIVALFLARYGEPVDGSSRALPPRELGVLGWNEAYEVFYRKLGGERSSQQFRNSLKNARDLFDGHVASPRVGWKEGDGSGVPQRLTAGAQRAWDQLMRVSRDTHWQLVALQLGPSDGGPLVDAADTTDARTEGGVAVKAVTARERDPRLRIAAFEVHGTNCMACHFDFGAQYGEWGQGFAEVHHAVPLAKGTRETDPRQDLVVLCANCHSMVHRHTGIVLSLEELRARIVPRPRF
jgi:5-methylcytosine-specific restriction protein A